MKNRPVIQPQAVNLDDGEGQPWSSSARVEPCRRK